MEKLENEVIHYASEYNFNHGFSDVRITRRHESSILLSIKLTYKQIDHGIVLKKIDGKLIWVIVNNDFTSLDCDSADTFDKVVRLIENNKPSESS